ncbi:UDP-glucoronosyl and UDP-glucosyl transferase [Oesophagostomum dentatum]|uniref:glucuronosyltransferase n=1 Tax=Oesophagostomum dentatum TaxID=61180 RepID=A0A0B1TEE7_OESDE|nr:UDP-glucoronosyl and UDP-glucosyl transferase [Oesophagostomum dentatum]
MYTPVLALLLSLSFCNAYKILVYSPIFGYSHINFMGAIADALTEAGHNVTLLMPIMEIEQQDKTGVKLTKNIIKIPPSSGAHDFLKRGKEIYSKLWNMEPSMLALMQMSQNMTRLCTSQCEKIVSDASLLRRLKEEKFDLGIAEAFSVCGFGVFELANIPTSIATSASVYVDALSKAVGEPIAPSYVPAAMSAASDRMNFMERLINAIGVVLGQRFLEDVYEAETEVFRKRFGRHFKGWQQLLSESSFVLTNANPYLDYPRPMLHKTIPIGGVAVFVGRNHNKLTQEWNEVLDERNRTVLVSFGSVARAIYMPHTYKKALLKVFESMPDTTFIMKYEEKNSKIAAHLPNVHLSPWLPQNALLADPRLTAFVTHGGLASTTELAHQGNQPYCYTQNAKRLAEMLLSQPISAKELLVRHCEYAARFGRLPNLDPYGRQLSFVQYYLLDIIASAIGVLLLITCAIFLLLRRCVSFAVKQKKD